MALDKNSVVWKEGFKPRKDPEEAKRAFQLTNKNSQMSGDFARKCGPNVKKKG